MQRFLTKRRFACNNGGGKAATINVAYSEKLKRRADDKFMGAPVEFYGSAVLLPNEILKYPATLKQKPSPEIAFAGESNVGKSMLINALIDSDIVKTSRKTGHTKHLNFFGVGEKFTLVDMPGYGKGSNSHWGDLVLKYLQERRSLRRLFLLRDCRRQLKTVDQDIIRILEDFGVPYQIVLTKSDMFPPELEAFKRRICLDTEEFIAKNTTACMPKVLMTSSKSGDGISELRCDILTAIGQLK